MKLLLKAFAILYALIFMVNVAQAQSHRSPKYATNEALLELADRSIQTPIQRTEMSNGDVYLQREMAPALQSRFAPPPIVGQLEQGHDHNDDQLIEFLNRPHPSVATMQRWFQSASVEFGVPVQILMAIGQVQSNWAQVPSSMYGSWGVMGVIDNYHVDQIGDAARLLSVTKDQIKNEARTNIRAAAALLKKYQGARPALQLEDWYDAVRQLTGIPQPDLSASLTNDIYKVVAEGAKTVTLWREIIEFDGSPISLPQGARTNPVPLQQNAAPDHPGVAVVRPCSTNYGTRTDTTAIYYYFVHYVGTGTYAGAISWFQNCTSGVSAHYVVRNSDGFITQMVDEKDRAFSQGVSLYNQQGIGVEHEVIATNLAMWDSPRMLDSAAALMKEVCNRRGIPLVHNATVSGPGVYGHNQVRSTECPNLTAERWQALMDRANGVPVRPPAPVLYSVTNPGSGNTVTATWRQSTQANLVGYRLLYAIADDFVDWEIAADETTLTATTTSVTLDPANFKVPPTGNVYHFRLQQVVNSGTGNLASNGSDIYSRSSNETGKKVLIVDGFDRIAGSASYQSPTHNFAARYFKALRTKGSFEISTAANEVVENGTVSLTGYDLVVWFVGDESSVDVVFSAAEKTAIKAYLANGGKMIISGSEIAYNVGRTTATTYDADFMGNYLKSTYTTDGAATYTPATGIYGGPFEGLIIPFGVVYPEDFPDGIAPANGSISIFDYWTGNFKGGIAYKGTFGTGTTPGGIIFLSFTLETALDEYMNSFMHKAIKYFDWSVKTYAPTAIDDQVSTLFESSKVINVIANDKTNDSPIDIATLTITSMPTNGTAMVDSLGAIVYKPAIGFSGTDNLQYTIANEGGTSNAASVTITVGTNAFVQCDPANTFESDNAHPKKEMRGVWIATVSNIDWPTRGASPATQQAQLTKILDTLAKSRINTVFLQVRTSGDALYESSIEPWSYWLTGTMGQAPSPSWDPLQFAINEAHKRGMQLHAWINPFRAKKYASAASNHVAVLHPEWLLISGTDSILNPGIPAVRDYVTSIVTDIATRYDVDGIHFDDYFYSYSGTTTQDAATYTANNPTNIATIEDWRRNNINTFIGQIYDAIGAINTSQNRNIIFGVSPFGIWKSGTPTGITGTSSFTTLYCDPIAWLAAGKVDYIAPQLYWKIVGAQDYERLSQWWNDQGALYNRHIYVGQATYRVDAANGNWNAAEIQKQIALNRSETRKTISGQIFYNYNLFNANPKGLKTILQNEEYGFRAYPQPMSWKDNVCPQAPSNLRFEGGLLKWDAPAAAADGDVAKRYVVYAFIDAADAVNINDGRKVYAITPDTFVEVPVPNGIVAGRNIPQGSYLAVSALDDNNNESQISTLILPVTGLEFEVQLVSNVSKLNWKTQSETNTHHFDIERSTNGTDFTKLGTVQAAGTSASVRTYDYNDILRATGTYYYRLKVVDKDGRFVYSEKRKVDYIAGKIETVIAPNPFQQQFTVFNLQQAERVELYDVAGKLVLSKSVVGQSDVQLNAAGLPGGVYYLSLIRNNQRIQTLRLVKLK